MTTGHRNGLTVSHVGDGGEGCHMLIDDDSHMHVCIVKLHAGAGTHQGGSSPRGPGGWWGCVIHYTLLHMLVTHAYTVRAPCVLHPYKKTWLLQTLWTLTTANLQPAHARDLAHASCKQAGSTVAAARMSNCHLTAVYQCCSAQQCMACTYKTSQSPRAAATHKRPSKCPGILARIPALQLP